MSNPQEQEQKQEGIKIAVVMEHGKILVGFKEINEEGSKTYHFWLDKEQALKMSKMLIGEAQKL